MTTLEIIFDDNSTIEITELEYFDSDNNLKNFINEVNEKLKTNSIVKLNGYKWFFGDFSKEGVNKYDL